MRGAVGKLHRAGGHLDIFLLGARQRSDARLANGLGDGGDGGEIALRSHGKAGLDDVHAQVLQGVRHGELFLGGHAAAGRLLAVAQSGVEERYMMRGPVIGGLMCTHRLRPGRETHFSTNSKSLIVSRNPAV